MRSRVHVFTQHPTSGRPVSDVQITGTLTISDGSGNRVLKLTGRSNASGYAALDFEIPDNLQDPNATLHVRAALGNFKKELSEDLDFQDRSEILLSTDKPIYQPGQQLQIRILAFDASKRALARVPMEVKIYDPEFSTVYRTEVITSGFGEADTEWAIPDNIRLGDCRIGVGPRDRYQSVTKSVRIGRYDLPGFTVTPKPDEKFYLPNRNAQVEVRADYLFGQPVKQGRVKVVRENMRHWNYRNQKWEMDEDSVVEGHVDSQGRFLAIIDLHEEHDRLRQCTTCGTPTSNTPRM